MKSWNIKMKSYKLTPELLYAVGLGLDVQMMECVTHWIVLFKTFVKKFPYIFI
jgi:hypothetical protein